jgi:hypothetical protein
VRKARIVVWIRVGKLLSSKQRKKLKGITGGSVGTKTTTSSDADSIKDPFRDDDDDDAYIAITAKPWAKVYIDGRLIGNTPTRTKVTPGKHKVVLIWDDSEKKKTMLVTASAGRTVRLAIEP